MKPRKHKRWTVMVYLVNTPDAVRSASLQVLSDRRARRVTTHPFYWAGFVAAGAWQ